MRRFAYSVKEAAEGLGVGKSTLYRELDKGNIPSVKIGARRVIPRIAMKNWMEELCYEWDVPHQRL